jgi:hypothetical protein
VDAVVRSLEELWVVTAVDRLINALATSGRST